MSFAFAIHSMCYASKLGQHSRLLRHRLPMFFLLDIVLCTVHLQHGSASEILLLSNCSKIWACADRFDFIIKFRRRLMVMFTWGMSVSHSVIWKDESALLIPDMRLFSLVWISRSAMNFLQFCRGAIFTASYCSSRMITCYSLASLCSRMLVGSHHFYFSWASSIRVASCRVSVFLFGIGYARIAFAS